VSNEIPNFNTFYNYIQNGEFDKAVDTKVLTRLIESKFAKTEPCHLTAEKLLKPNGERVWSIKWIDSIISDINTESDSKDIEDKFNLVELQFKIEKEKRRINTEFFYYNPAKSFDDREKLHIVWKIPNKSSQQLELVYLGVGTNEPFDFQHIETGTESCKGRARFYIYASDDSGNKAISHQFEWKDMGIFDWSWSNYPVKKEKNIYRAYFVDYLGMRICISDPNIANAASSLTADNVFQMFCTNLQLPVTSISQATLADRESFLRSIRLVQVQVSSLQENPQVTPPDYRMVLRDTVKNYNAYFTIFGCSHLREKDPIQLRANIKQLKDARMEQYENIFAATCKDVICDKYNCYLSEYTLENLFVNPIQNNWPKELQEKVLNDEFAFCSLFSYKQ